MDFTNLIYFKAKPFDNCTIFKQNEKKEIIISFNITQSTTINY